MEEKEDRNSEQKNEKGKKKDVRIREEKGVAGVGTQGGQRTRKCDVTVI
jgi:hypothetical protein